MKYKYAKKILMTSSTFPASDNDPVPAFVKDEAIWFNKVFPDTEISVLAPHNAYSNTKSFSKHKHYTEYRFHYFWPYSFEKLAGRGIQPAIKKNRFLILQLPFFFIGEFIATWKLARKLKPDILYAHWFTPQAITCALVSRLTNIPFVFDTQASDVIVLKNVPFSKHMIANICSKALAYTAPSQQTADKLLYFASKKNKKSMLKKLKIIPMGTTYYKVSKPAISHVIDQYSLQNKTIILFIGRLVGRKGVDTLITAFKNLSRNNTNTLLVIAGDGQERDALMKLVDSANLSSKVVFTGYVTGETKYALLQLAKILVIPSVNEGDQAEGLPITFMEGLTYEKAVVISDQTGAHEVVQHGINAFVFKAGSAEGLEKSIGQALDLAENDKFKSSVKKLSDAFQWQTIARKRYEILCRLDEMEN